MLMLRFDLLFPAFYGPALIFGLRQAITLWGSAFWGGAIGGGAIGGGAIGGGAIGGGAIGGDAIGGGVPAWLALLPAVTMAADWLENSMLLWQIPRYDKGDPPAGLMGWAISLASTGTVVKLITITASLLLLIVLWLRGVCLSVG